MSLTAPPSAGLNSSIVERLAGIEGIAWAGAFGPAQDGRNNLVSSSAKVATRPIWSTNNSHLRLPEDGGGSAWASPQALSKLGMIDGVGALALGDQTVVGISGTLMMPSFLDYLEPAVLIPRDASRAGAVTLVVAVAEAPEQVAAVGRALTSLANAAEPEKMKLQSSELLANLRLAVEGRPGEYGREITIGCFVITALPIAAVQLALVVMRRKDFGRRRALGATRGYVLSLITTQAAIAAAGGTLVGLAVSTAVLMFAGSPHPSAQFNIAIMLLMFTIATLASVPPAVVAARRDPAAELRVP